MSTVEAGDPVLDGESEAETRLVPRELLVLFLARLEVSDRLQAAGVCRRWRAAAGEAQGGALSLTVVAGVPQPDDGEADAKTVGELLPVHRLQHVPPSQRRRRALSPARAAALLRRPLCAGLSELRLSVLLLEPGGSGDVVGLAAALPPSLRRLTLACPCDHAKVGDLLLSVGSELAAAAPALAQLCLESTVRRPELEFGGTRLDSEERFAAFDGVLTLVPGGAGMPALPCLERLEATLYVGDAPRLLRACPALRAVRRVEVADEAALRALAAGGVRCGALAAQDLDLGRPGLAAALCDVLRPSGPARLFLRGRASRLPDAWPEGALAGLRECAAPAWGDGGLTQAGPARLELREGSLSAASLRLPAAAPTLRAVRLKRVALPGDGAPLRPPRAPACRVRGPAAGAAELAAALRLLPAAAFVELAPSPRDPWPPAALAALARALAAAPGLLRRVHLTVPSAALAAYEHDAEARDAFAAYEAARAAARARPAPAEPPSRLARGLRRLSALPGPLLALCRRAAAAVVASA